MIILYLLLGLIQGLTEFLPVSSSGHIVLFSQIFGINTDILLLSIVVHLGTLVSVCVCMRQQIWALIKKPFCAETWRLVLATLPTVVIALIFHDTFERAFGGKFLIVGFLATAILLVVADFLPKKVNPITNKTAFAMGLAQGLAIFPGLSRSGTTITTALICGTEKEKATEFSFLMSIPVIVGSALMECLDLTKQAVSVDVLTLAVAFVSAVISGIFSIKIMLKVVKSNKFIYFAYYLIAVCILMLIFL